MPPKRKAAPKKKAESPPPSESESEPEPESESEPDYSSEEEPDSPKPKKTKAAAKPKAPTPKAKAAPSPSPKKNKAPAVQKKQATKKSGKPEVVSVEKPAPAPSPVKKSAPKVAPGIVIEHCKQCQSFKRTAGKLEQLLKKSIPDLDVSMNPGPEKPRKGIFEVRDTNGNVFISLQGLVRPFKKMKELNLEETADDVVSKLA